MKSSFRLLAAIALMLSVSACAESASKDAMSVPKSQLPLNQSYLGKMAVRDISGGQETSPLWKSRVDNAGFKAALQDSLANYGYTAPAGTTPTYFVDAELKSIDQPMVGFDFDITSTIDYKVAGNGTAQTYPVTATGTASVSDAFVGVKRLKVANERSIQENIKAFLISLSKDAR